MNKKQLTKIALTISLVGSLFVPTKMTQAANVDNGAAKGALEAYVDGVRMNTYNYGSLNKDGVMYLPFRDLVPRLGLTYTLSGKTLTMKHPRHSTKITHEIGTNIVMLDNKKFVLNGKSFVSNNLTYVPARIVEVLDGSVYFKPTSNTLQITTGDLREVQRVMFASLAYDDLRGLKEGDNLGLVDYSKSTFKKSNEYLSGVKNKLNIYTSMKDVRMFYNTFGATDWNFVATVQDAKTGFKGSAFINKNTSEVMMSFAGTENMTDAWQDTKWLNQNGTNQYPYAQELLVKVNKKYPTNKITLVGHSLGGYLVQKMAQEYPGDITQAFTYNAPGPRNGSVQNNRVTNFIILEDEVRRVGNHIGKMVAYNANANQTSPVAAHGLFNFYGKFFSPSISYFTTYNRGYWYYSNTEGATKIYTNPLFNSQY